MQIPHAQNPHRWGVILAGGDGKRLRSLTRRISGDDRPKQFCALTCGETLLDLTRQRVNRMIPEQNTLLALTQTHERFFAKQTADVPPSRLLVQPYNHGTAPAIAYSLMRLHHLDPEGVVAFFPSDHHFADNDAFASCIDLAFAEAERHLDRVILLGVAPDAPDDSYGWIEPGEPLAGTENSVCGVRRFCEKPSRMVASRLMRRGCLWNSFVMVGRVSAFLSMLRRTLPDLMTSLDSVWTTRVLGKEDLTLLDLYAAIPAADFSNQVLSVDPSALAVLRADGLGWSDLGEPERVYSVLRSKGLNPSIDFEWIGQPVAAV